ncbi:hypothetical protein ATK74_0822 [Propionicimonas paludicola]|uniref:Uncharacterized protein n=1 Tax=Propionicimonas paludicola TaxID=185243 RepID=A0A2A9CPL4_9ACTN|nr:hypothetical protein [Propionicimonas paludicola]PFG16288.1 hypothetical protein ATK74_0822 [Propionicimonas paludicola]
MPVPGRKQKTEGQAITRHPPTTEWVLVEDVPFTGGPKLPRTQPDGRAWPTWTKRWWATVSTMPHCSLWTASDWEFAMDTAALKAKFHTDGGTGMATEIRNREKVLGTTVDYRRDLRIRYFTRKPEVAEDAAPAAVVSLDDYREL